ncbi:MAG: hypothetical protein VB046_07910 [Paludibacter sp.]|nr:hypothetical protein [Paludibacter sp.]
MKIQQKRIRKVEAYLAGIAANEEFSIALVDIERYSAQITNLDFSTGLIVGESILPKIVGPVSLFNADGKTYPIRDLPKETYYISRYWTWKDWGGNEHSDIVYISRERYQRGTIEAPCIELTIEQVEDYKILQSKKFKNSPDNFEEIKHTINLFLEIFGECDTLSSNQHPIHLPKVIRLNWKVLPKGEYPWGKLEPIVKQRVAGMSVNNRMIITNRFEKISSKKPDFVAFGAGGFSDYTVFGFQQKSIYILESMRTGNAIYVFEKDWEELSKLTKKEILDNDLHKARIIHKENWERELFGLL